MRQKRQALHAASRALSPMQAAHVRWLMKWGAWADTAMMLYALEFKRKVHVYNDGQICTFVPPIIAHDDIQLALVNGHFFPYVNMTNERVNKVSPCEHLSAGGSSAPGSPRAQRSRTPPRPAASAGSAHDPQKSVILPVTPARAQRSRTPSRDVGTATSPSAQVPDTEYIYADEGEETWLNVGVMRQKLSWRVSICRS